MFAQRSAKPIAKDVRHTLSLRRLRCGSSRGRSIGFAMRSPSRCKDAQSLRLVFAKLFAMQRLGGCVAIGVGMLCALVPWEQGSG